MPKDTARKKPGGFPPQPRSGCLPRPRRYHVCEHRSPVPLRTDASTPDLRCSTAPAIKRRAH
eukprot:scaffold33211_cov33-Tisochrysis_lutea.AAC.5